jgi:hypothetical protein
MLCLSCREVSEFSTFFCVVVSNPQKVGYCLAGSPRLKKAVSRAITSYTTSYTAKRGERDGDKAWVTSLILNSKFWAGVKIEFVTGIIRAEGPFAPRPALDPVRRRPSRSAEHLNSGQGSQECCGWNHAALSEGRFRPPTGRRRRHSSLTTMIGMAVNS